MTKDQEHILLTCKFSQIPGLFPGHDPEELRLKRLALQKAKCQADYRRRNYAAAQDDDMLDPLASQRAWESAAVESNRRYIDRLRELGA
jgi:hypothetical protein